MTLREEAEQWDLELEVRREIRGAAAPPLVARARELRARQRDRARLVGRRHPRGLSPALRLCRLPRVRYGFPSIFLFSLVMLSCLSSISVDLKFSWSHHIFSVEYRSHYCCITFYIRKHAPFDGLLRKLKSPASIMCYTCRLSR
jgi:hypothetical protein